VGDLREPALRDGAFVLKQHKNAIHVVMGGIRTQNAVNIYESLYKRPFVI